MVKKHHTFVILIVIILYILYSIIDHKYKEYKINSHIEYIAELNEQIKEKISIAGEIIDYKKSKAYKNKVLKEEQGLKNKGEIVIYLTTEDKYNKYTSSVKKEQEVVKREEQKSDETYGMTIYQKWMYFIFKKDIR